MNSAGSIQTPPPTSTSASRRRSQQAQVTKLLKESAEKGRRMSFPAISKTDTGDGPNQLVEESPQPFPNLQFSPDGFGFPTSGPATAPAYPQHKLFWDPEQNDDTMNLDFPMDDNFASFGVHKNLDPFVTNHDGGGIQFPTSPPFSLLGTKGEDEVPFTSSHRVEATNRSASSASMRRKPSRGNGVDPSLLFSSPGRSVEGSCMPRSEQTIQDDNLLPYAHQLRDAQMELEMQMSRKQKRKRGPDTDSPAVTAALQTLREDQVGIKRDIADDIITSTSAHRPASRTSRHLVEEELVGNRKVLSKQRSKSRLQDPESEIPQHKRTSVTLMIDANGRAKTQTKYLTGDKRQSGNPAEPDSDAESESTSCSSADDLVTSQTNSFAYPKPKSMQKQPKLGRFSHTSRSHSQKSSYASTLGSANIVRTVSENTARPSSSGLFAPLESSRRPPRVSFNDLGRNEAESEAETVIDSEDDKGDAQSALKKVLQSRQRKDSKRPQNSRSNNLSFEQRNAYPPSGAPSHPYYLADSFTPTRSGYNQSYNNISPTTITDPDLATPSSARSNLSSDSIRCLCHANDDDGQLMIQW